MKSPCLRLLAPIALALSGIAPPLPAQAANPAPATLDAVTVQFAVCASCHGAHGEGRPELGAPRIGDLDAEYIEAQLVAFHEGTRGSHPDDLAARPMVAIAAGRTDDFGPLATFVAGLDPAPRPPTPAPVLPEVGEDGVELESDDVSAYASCEACHGPDATGNSSLGAPALLHQDPDYLRRQLVSYRQGVRGGPASAPQDQQMAAMATGMDDATVEQILSEIGAMRPPLPPLDNPAVTLEAQAGLDAFADIYSVATHPRCMNCHPAGDAPLQTDDSTPHTLGVTRFSPLSGMHCSMCHAASPVGDGLAPLPPADPVWSMPPQAMAFQGRTPAELCAQLLDPEANGGRGLTSLIEHVQQDHLLQTSWHSGRTAPPMTHEELVERFVTWAAAGGPCPE